MRSIGGNISFNCSYLGSKQIFKFELITRMILELSILVISIAMICLALYLRNHDSTTAEPFQVEEESYLHSCPSGYTSYHLTNGNTACCKGEIVANECMSDDACLLNGKGTMEKCTTVITNEYKKKAIEQCPSSMSSYFEYMAKKGCTDGPLNTTLTGPQHTTQKTCTIYNTMDLNLNSLDSCSNQKEMEEFPCFGNNCKKSLVQATPSAPVQVSVGFIDSNFK